MNSAELKNLIAEIAESAELDGAQTDESVGCAWRNGRVDHPTENYSVPMGGGWIETEASAELQNEEAGIAAGLRQGVYYPNETVPGEFTAYGLGEDESGWQKEIMPALLGEDWEDHEDADEVERMVFEAVQAELKIAAARS